jgi:Cu-Zn family superoxide dismutase
MKKKSFVPELCFYLLTMVSILAISCNNDSSSGASSSDTATAPAADTSHQMNMPADTARVTTIAMAGHAEAMLSGTYPDTTVEGTLKFDTANGKVKMKLEITIPKKAGKSVAVHIHEHGDCADTAKMAHGHWNPTHAQHGKWGSASFHSGDIGNVKLDAKGKGTLTITTDLWTLGGAEEKNILGKAIIVHGGVDDYKSQPAGNAGTRIGCGVIH